MSATDTDQEPATASDQDAHADSGAATSGDQPATTGAPAVPARRLTVRPLPMVLGALVLAAAVAVGLLGVQAWTLHRAEGDAAAALDSARTRTVQVLSFDPKTVDADVARAKEQLSGTFAAQFDQLVNALILPSSKQQGMSSKVEVKNAALIDSQPDRAEALLLLHQVVTSSSSPQPIEGTIQVKTTLTKSPEGQWLISNLQPI